MGSETLLVCPFNSSHRILSFRMLGHVAKCQKQHGDRDIVTCVYNSTHNIPGTEYQHHLEYCPDRYNLDKLIFVPADANQKKYKIPKIEVRDDEKWDEVNHDTYKPEAYCEKKIVLRQAKVEPAAVRKVFRSEERTRIQKLKESGLSNTAAQSPPPASKFRSTALANTTTNVVEQSPYSYAEMENLIRMRNVTPMIVDQNHHPRPVNQPANRVRQQIDEPMEEEAAGSSSSSSSLSSSASTGAVKKQSADGFIVQKSRKKLGRGRGRGLGR